MHQPPALAVGLVNTAGVGSVQDGNDTYSTSLAHEASLPDQTPCAYIRVGRGLQPVGFAGYHVSVDPQ